MTIDPLTIGMLVILAILIIFMFRSSRKRKAQAAELAQKVVAGADVMTNFGLYGTITHIDEEDNKILLEIAPGTIVTVHRQTVTRVIDDHQPVEDGTGGSDSERAGLESSSAQPELNADHAVRDDNPEFGERLGGAKPADKKADE